MSRSLLAVLLLSACSTGVPGDDLAVQGDLDAAVDQRIADLPADLPGIETIDEDLGPVDVAADEVGFPDLPDIADDVPDGVETVDLLPEPADAWDALDGADGEVDAGPPCDPEAPCDDGNPCTVGDECTEDGCLGVPMDCSDGLECTFDLCDGGQCDNPMKPGWCWIMNGCWQEGALNPNNPCLECITSHKVYSWSADDSNTCDDGNLCSDPDECSQGQCVGVPITCDDANPCTEDACYNGGCSHVPLNGIACEDGNLCTLEDVCFAGECVAGGGERECDDFNPCTADGCDPVGGCEYLPADGLECEDGNLCTVGDQCKSSLCMPGEPAVCDDENGCTTDTCSPLIGCKFVNNANPCDDGNPCTVGDQCLGGVCKKGPGTLDCEDDNTCTSEWCAPYVGCQYAALVAACSDGNGCTFGDHCQDGECVFDWEMDCKDDNPCTDDLCDPGSGCAFLNNSNPCDDGNPCTVGDQCVQGSCASGLVPLDCFADNPCATGSCDPAAGCVLEPLDGKPCDDGNVCTVDDFCLGGACEPGDATIVDCDDGNECTVDWCDPVLGCLHENIESSCNDGDLCTVEDECQDGVCIGLPETCDDANACTIDTCIKDQGCKHSVVVSSFCQPQLVIDFPPRAAELVGPPFVLTVKGHVVHNAAPVAWVNINGDEVAVQPDDTFTYVMTATQGLNILQAELYDLFDGHDRVVQTFLMSTGYIPMNAANPQVSMVQDGVMIFLGQNVWDDNQPDPNDFATFFTYFFNSLDLGAMLPNPLYENGSYKVSAQNLSHGPFALDITCINGGIHLVAAVPNLKVDLKAKSKKWYLPSASGDVKASQLVITMDVMLSVDGAGNVKAVLQNVKAEVKGLNVTLDGALGFLLNWLVDFFEGTFASMLEEQVIAAIQDTLPATLEDALEDLAFETAFELPPLLGDGAPVSLEMKSKVSSVSFSPIGGVLGLKAAVVTPKGVALDSKGSIKRGGCLGQEGAFAFWMLDEIEMGIHDDFLNQIPYAMWWAGLLTMPMDADALGGGSFEELGIADLNIVATGLLPPVLSDCTSNAMQIQMGDLELKASMNMFGMDVEVVMYASFTASVVISVISLDGQAALDMAVTDVEEVLLEVATVSENLVGSEDSLRALVKQQVLPLFLEQLTEGSLASFPLPEMDMTGMIPGMPGEAKLDMTPKSTYREKSYTVVTGSVHE